jgi:hypothetical protein
VTKVWLADGWKYYDEKWDEGGQKVATVQCTSWIAIEVPDTEKQRIQFYSQKRPKTKFVEESKGDTTVCWKELKTSWMYMDGENRTDEVPMAN